MNAKRPYRVSDEVSEIGVFVIRGLYLFPTLRIQRRENQATVQGEGQAGREEESHRDHVGWIVVEVAVGVANVIDPVEVAEDPVRKAMSPGSQQDWSKDDQRHVGQNGEAEGDRDMVSHTQFPTDLDLAQGPGDEGQRRANRDDLPKATFHERRDAKPDFEWRWINGDQPWVPSVALAGSPEDHCDPQCREKQRRDTEEAYVERAHPKIEQIAPDKRPTSDAVFFLEAEQCHLLTPV